VPQVTLATIHASKGKEFPHVVMFHLARTIVSVPTGVGRRSAG
jgi:superfamily I DNA/RNA helicase